MLLSVLLYFPEGTFGGFRLFGVIAGKNSGTTNDTPVKMSADYSNRVYCGVNSPYYHNHDSATSDHCTICNAYLPKQPNTNTDGKYKISNVNELYWFAALVNGELNGIDAKPDAKAILIANITYSTKTNKRLNANERHTQNVCRSLFI